MKTCDAFLPVEQRERICDAVACIKNGGLISFPTESYYGLGVDPFSEKAVKRLFDVKMRKSAKAVLVLIAERESLFDLVASIPDVYTQLMDAFWPGPLTLLFPARNRILRLLLGGTGNIGIRISSNSVATEVCRKLGGPVTATSANLSGMEPARSASDVVNIFGENIDLVLDGGSSDAQAGSTIVGCKDGDLYLVREGLIPWKQIRTCL